MKIRFSSRTQRFENLFENLLLCNTTEFFERSIQQKNVESKGREVSIASAGFDETREAIDKGENGTRQEHVREGRRGRRGKYHVQDQTTLDAGIS